MSALEKLSRTALGTLVAAVAVGPTCNFALVRAANHSSRVPENASRSSDLREYCTRAEVLLMHGLGKIDRPACQAIYTPCVLFADGSSRRRRVGASPAGTYARGGSSRNSGSKSSRRRSPRSGFRPLIRREKGLLQCPGRDAPAIEQESEERNTC